MYDSDQRKLLSALCHGAIFFSATLISIGIPITVLFLSNDPIVKDNAKESLNFHINVYIYGLIFLILSFLLIGIPLVVLLGVASWIMPILAILKVLDDPNYPYRYPLIFRFL